MKNKYTYLINYLYILNIFLAYTWIFRNQKKKKIGHFFAGDLGVKKGNNEVAIVL